ncbi:MAG: hypothetical protein ACKVHQ_15145, partial [Gammaproteobacteria bacterium]
VTILVGSPSSTSFFCNNDILTGLMVSTVLTSPKADIQGEGFTPLIAVVWCIGVLGQQIFIN